MSERVEQTDTEGLESSQSTTTDKIFVSRSFQTSVLSLSSEAEQKLNTDTDLKH